MFRLPGYPYRYRRPTPNPNAYEHANPHARFMRDEQPLPGAQPPVEQVPGIQYPNEPTNAMMMRAAQRRLSRRPATGYNRA